MGNPGKQVKTSILCKRSRKMSKKNHFSDLLHFKFVSPKQGQRGPEGEAGPTGPRGPPVSME